MIRNAERPRVAALLAVAAVLAVLALVAVAARWRPYRSWVGLMARRQCERCHALAFAEPPADDGSASLPDRG